MNRELLEPVLAEALRHDHFRRGLGGSVFTSTPTRLTLRWEVFRGQLLDPAMTRQERTFLAWPICFGPASPPHEPDMALLLDQEQGQLHCIRGLRIHGWEAYDEGGAILSRPVQKWVAELVGSIELTPALDTGTLAALVKRYLHQAVVGRSRLPITSLEGPHPAYTAGTLAYLPEARAWTVGTLDFALRSNSDGAEIAAAIAAETSPTQATTLFRELFNHAVLSPWTGYVATWLDVVRRLGAGWGRVWAVDLLSYYLRHLVRHLTAFDLVTFHNQGANYPDALFLDLLLEDYAAAMAAEPTLFAGESPVARRRRRAWRQAWLMRKQLEGLPVPERPTSPGENARVSTTGEAPVPDEQLTDPRRRPIRLFAHQPAERHLSPRGLEVLQAALADLDHGEELRELGMAVFLDRPLGYGKALQRVLTDRTPLLSYEALSRKVACARLSAWRDLGWLPAERARSLENSPIWASASGLAVADVAGAPRVGVAALEDALKVAHDFRLLTTTRSSLRNLLRHYDWSGLAVLAPATHAWFAAGRRVLLVRSPRSRRSVRPDSFLLALDETLTPRVELALGSTEPPDAVRYVEWAGEEYLADGLCLIGVADAAGSLTALPQPCPCPPMFALPA